MSDFLQFVDRIPTISNRKKITFDDLSIKYAKVEYADLPIEDGTPLNKGYFNRINNVLGYNESIATNITITEEMENLDSQVYNQHSRYDYIPTGKSEFVYGYLLVTDSTPNYIRTDPNYDRANDYIGTAEAAGTYSDLKLYKHQSGGSTVRFLFDTVEKIKDIYFSIYAVPASSYSSSTYATVTLFDENAENIDTFRLNMNSSGSISQTFSLSDYTNVKGFEIYWYLGSSKNNYLDLGFRKIKKTISFQRNLFDTINVANDFINNQIIKIQSKNVLQCSDNYFKNILIDTILENNKYYELLYDQTNNRFIAEEVRNDI